MTIDDLKAYKPIYLATPYTKYTLGIHMAYRDAALIAARLIMRGANVYSPIVHSHPIAMTGHINPLDHTIWLPFNDVMVGKCDALLIATLDDWRESHGVAHEIGQFIAADKPIFTIHPDTLAVAKYGRN